VLTNPQTGGGGYVTTDITYASNFPSTFGTANEGVGNNGILTCFKAA
jgi:hypothetical protein